jgi:hypothetical protein
MAGLSATFYSSTNHSSFLCRLFHLSLPPALFSSFLQKGLAHSLLFPHLFSFTQQSFSFLFLLGHGLMKQLHYLFILLLSTPPLESPIFTACFSILFVWIDYFKKTISLSIKGSVIRRPQATVNGLGCRITCATGRPWPRPWSPWPAVTPRLARDALP